MSLGKLYLLIKIAGICLVFQSAVGQETKSVQQIKQRQPTSTSSLSLAASYLMWNEPMKISKGSASEKGFADYAGFALGVEKSWIRGRRSFGTSLGIASGKAAAGGFGTSVSFQDGVQRSWWAAQLTIFYDYRLNPIFMMGIGILSRYRVADWVPQDSALSIDYMSNTQITGQINFRWSVSRRVLLMQSFAPLDLTGATLWQWTAQFNF